MYLKTPIPQQSKLVYCAELGMDAPELVGIKIRIGDDFIAVPNAVDRLVCKHTDLDSVDETHTFALDGHVVYQNDDCAVEMYMDNYLSADDAAEEGDYCAACAGSGEGQYDGSRCGYCGGSGVPKGPLEEQEDRRDYEGDR